MESGVIKAGELENVRVHGVEQGYQPLYVRHKFMDTPVAGPITPVMETHWYPTPNEIAALIRGAPIVSEIVGSVPPPMRLLINVNFEQGDDWVIIKAGYYYRPNKSGYTKHLSAAGRYTAKDAKAECEVEPWHMHAERASEAKDEL